MIFVDLDDTLADFSGAVNSIFYKKGLPDIRNSYWDNHDDEFWEHIKPNAEFWLSLKPLTVGIQVWNKIKHLYPCILTAYSNTNSLECKIGKRMWIEKHGLISNGYGKRVNIVKRSEKKKFATTNGTPNVLIDDYDKNCQEFESAGGIAIQFNNNLNSIIAKLKNLNLL